MSEQTEEPVANTIDWKLTNHTFRPSRMHDRCKRCMRTREGHEGGPSANPSQGG